MRASMALAVAFFTLSVICTGVSADTVSSKKSAGCKTPLDLVASQMPNLPMHPVFQEILNSPSLRGTFFVPTAKAWDSFFATVRQRQGNPEAPAMVARYGQVMLYHLAQGINVPIATPTPGASKFAFDTASTLQCSMGPGLPNNRVVVKKTPQAIYLEHGTGNATIVSQPIGYCGGEAYLVDQVLVPCSDVSAIMGEIANVPNPCKNNVEGVLQRNSLSYYNALLLATGINRPIFAAVRPFTIFAPSDAAIQSAYESGTFNYPELFATNKPLLSGIVSYHAVPQVAFTAPNKSTSAMETMLGQGHGNATCAHKTLSWRPDGFVYGGNGAAKVGGTYDRGCAAVIFTIDDMLQPCCKPVADLLESLKAPKGSMTDRALNMLKDKVKSGLSGARSTFVLPTEAAWDALKAESKKKLTDEQLDALLQYLWTGADVSDVVESATPVKTGLTLAPEKAQKAICPKGTNSTLVFAYDTTPPAAAAAPATAAAAAADDDSMTGLMAPFTAPSPTPALPALSYAAPAYGSPVATTVALPGMGNAQLLVNGLRRLQATKLPTGAASGSLLLPTSFGGLGKSKDGASVIAGPVMIMDGAAMQLRLPQGVAVKSISYGCDGTLFHVDAVPLPCNFLGRTAAARPVAAVPKALPMATMTINAALVNTSNIPQAAQVPTVPVSGTAAAAAPLALGSAAAVVLAALLL